LKVAINGFGRIGRQVLRIGAGRKGMDFVAINDLTDAASLAHLFKYDSTHGRFDGEVSVSGNTLTVNGDEIKVLSERDPAQLPWKDLGVDVVIESTGVFRKIEDVKKHMDAGAKKVILSAPLKGEGAPMIVLGINDEGFDFSANPIISNASCTTNCLAPVAKVLNDEFGLEKGFITTIHAYTSDQKILDAPHKDLRRARSAAANIIPTTTGAAKAIGKIMPELAGKLDGCAMRVPVVNGSITDLVAELKKETSIDEVNTAMKKAADGKLKGIFEYTEEPIVSTDIIGNPASSIFDASATMANGNMVKVLSWYDNEVGYSTRLVDLIETVSK